MSQFIITVPDVDDIPAFLDSLAERDEYSEFIDAHRAVLIGFLDQVFDQLAFSGQEILPSEESQQCPEMNPVDDEPARSSKPYSDKTLLYGLRYSVDKPNFKTEAKPTHDKAIEMVEQYRSRFNDIVADAYDTERALERIQS